MLLFKEHIGIYLLISAEARGICEYLLSKILTEECYMISCCFGMMLLQFGVLNFFVDKQVAMSHKTAASMIAGGGLMFLLSVVLWLL